MTEQAKVPAIRFAGFTDPWEQRKLGDVADLLTGYPFESRHFTDTGIPLVRGMNVKRGYLDMSADICENWSDAVGVEDYLLKAGDIVIQMDGALIGSSYAMVTPENTPSLLVQRVTRVRCGNRSRYIFQAVQRGFLRYIKSLKTETAVPHLSLSDIADYAIPVPKEEREQEHIGSFFSRLDDLITLHQRKYDKLVIFKKTMLEKMFPKDGESVPEIRFAGFTDPWEQRKLGELEKDATLYMGRGRVISAKDMSNTPGTFPVYSSSALDNGRMGAYGKYMFNQELITWSIDGGGAVFYRRKHRFSVTNVSGYIAVNPEKINCKFLAYAMSLAHSRIKFDYTVKAHPSVIRSLYTMGIPISLQEQQVIGSFFSRLDNLITLHQRKLELLRNIKKSLLDKMFV